MIAVFGKGVIVGAGLIIAIGSQNAFVLRQGLRKEHHLLVAGICLLCDAVLITIGVMGLGGLISGYPGLLLAAKWGGGLFLLWLGGRALGSLFRPQALRQSNAVPADRRAVVLATLAVTLLNPHVYLDTVIMLGSIGTGFGEQRLLFALGAICASLAWFYGLSLAAARLQPYLASPRSWQMIDSVLGLCLLGIGAQLLLSPLPRP